MLELNALQEEARSRTGLRNFGEDSFREPLEILLQSVNTETSFSEFGTVAFREIIIKSLTNRLEIEDWYTRHPEIDGEEIIQPTFIVGLPRTGSTLLTSLFALDPDTRTLRTWESSSPCPPPIKGNPNEPRIADAEMRVRLFQERWPLIFQMLPIGVHEPFECFELLFNAFCCDYYYQYSTCSKYLDWIYTPGRDLSFGYRYHKRALKLLQWRYPPNRWVLKMPGHSFMIDSLHRVYPDARFIMTHRDPVKVLPSVAHLVSLMYEDFQTNSSGQEFFEPQVAIWVRSLSRLVDFRQRHEDVFFDIHHANLLTDSIGEVRRAYKWLGWQFTPSLEAAISDWRAAHPREVAPSASWKVDVNVPDIEKRFAFYRDRFVK